MSNERQLVEVAKDLEITPDQLRYWLKLAGHETVKRGRERYLSPASVEAMIAVARLVATGVGPREAVRQVGGVIENVSHLPACREDVTGSQVAALTAEICEMKRVLLVLAEGQTTLRGRVEQLVTENQALRLRLEAPAQTPAALFEKPTQVIAWSPTPKPDPLAGEGIFARVWMHLVRPERLRRFVDN